MVVRFGPGLFSYIFAKLNAELKVEKLCKDFPSRIHKLVLNEGGRLKE